jgi:hypothetical protein
MPYGGNHMKAYKKKSEYNKAKELIVEKLTAYVETFGEVVSLTFDGGHERADGAGKVPNAYCLATVRVYTATNCSIMYCGNAIPAGCLAELRAWIPEKPERDAKLGRIYCSLSNCLPQWNRDNQKHKCSKSAPCHVWHLTQNVM